MYSSISNKEIYEGVELGARLTFFSPTYARMVALKMGKALGENVKYYDGVVPEHRKAGRDMFLSRVFSDGYDIYEFAMAPKDYQKALFDIMGAMHVIEAVGYTTDHCSVRLDMKIPGATDVNLFKIAMSIDEGQMIDAWGRHGAAKLYPMRSQYFHPRNVFACKPSPEMYENFSLSAMKLPVSEKFGMDFTNILEDRVGVNYIGGINYEKKPGEAHRTINAIIDAFASAKSGEYNTSESGNPLVTSDNFLAKQSSMKNYDSFVESYPSIELYFDMKCDPEGGRQRYPEIRESVFKIVTYGGVENCIINYDSETKRVQLKDAAIRQGFSLDGIDLLECKIQGTLSDCQLAYCEAGMSVFRGCRFLAENRIRKSNIYECEFGGNGNEMELCYVDNEEAIIHGDMRNCVAHGKMSYLSTINGRAVG